MSYQQKIWPSAKLMTQKKYCLLGDKKEATE